jgi:hypothetical protein
MNRARDLLACSAVSQPTAAGHTDIEVQLYILHEQNCLLKKRNNIWIWSPWNVDLSIYGRIAENFLIQTEWKMKVRRQFLAKTCHNELLKEICPASLNLILGCRGLNITCKYAIFNPFRIKISTCQYWFLNVCLRVHLSTRRLRKICSLW